MLEDLQNVSFSASQMSTCSFLCSGKPPWYHAVTVRMSSSRKKTFNHFDLFIGIALLSTLDRVCPSSCQVTPWQRRLLPERIVALACLSSAQRIQDHE